MNDNKSWSGIGEEIRDAVETALRTGSFRDIGDVMVNTGADIVKNVSSAVGQAVSGGSGGAAGADGSGGAGGVGGIGRNYTEKYAKVTRERQQAQAAREQAARDRALREAAQVRRYAPFRTKGKISSVLYQVFGGIGTGIMGILALVFGGLALVMKGGFLVAFIIFALLLAGFSTMIRVGCKQKERLERARKYLELAGVNHYINIDDIALHTGKTRKFILKDIKNMFEAGMFPEGHLDMQESCLILNDRIYKEYLSLEKQRRVQERENKIRQNKTQVQAEPEKTKESELDAMIAEGQECIRKLRDMNDNIPGEEISAKLFRLENLLKEIFDGLREHPEQSGQMRKFMNYYLPTTLKLVSAYEEFDELSAQGDEIKEAKVEIEKTLDTINGAFEELLNRMFRSTVYDVTTDAQVLQTMLAQEGLTKQREFEKIPRA